MAKFFQSKRGIIIKTISFFLHNSLLLLQASKRQIEWNIHATLNFKRKGRKRKRRERRPFFKFRKMKNEIKLTQICSEEAQPNQVVYILQIQIDGLIYVMFQRQSTYGRNGLVPYRMCLHHFLTLSQRPKLHFLKCHILRFIIVQISYSARSLSVILSLSAYSLTKHLVH